PPLRRLHAFEGACRYSGTASVEGAGNSVAWAIARLFGFPKATPRIEVEVQFTRVNGVETWRRRFAGAAFASTQEIGRGRNEGLLIERFGPLAFGLAVTEQGGRLGLEVRRWTLLGVPMPRRLAPWTRASEHDAGDRFNFDVEIGLPIVGRLVRYRGHLEPVAD
ncbi:MAG TPA: DUF4166 domain-containing protein, partial [Hyphomicrobiaceae bacterium]|nr:DUF4166 domain-containing protein [Hyphomicrobiaceae bacterium]